MKFSWKILNHLIHLRKITLNQFTEKLTLAGFEIEGIYNQNHISDIIIDLNITANRRDIYYLANLAEEISTIYNIPLRQTRKNPLINFNHILSHNIKLPINVLSIRCNIIQNIQYHQSPQWLKDTLISYSITNRNLFDDIYEYIKLKWGQEIVYIHPNNNQSIESSIRQKYNTPIEYISKTNIIDYKNKTIILSFPRYNWKIKYNNTNYTNHFFNAYSETIDLITTFTRGTVSKTYELYNTNNNSFTNSTKTILIDKNTIQAILGPLAKNKIKFLSQRKIFITLKQLNLQPIYKKYNKKFAVTIPQTRIHDLQRNIDIIEDIGRIYGFQNFLDQLPKCKSKGNSSINLDITYKIKSILRNIGLNEVINSSLTNHIEIEPSIINIYNPITEEQNKLRRNIIEQLLDNYIYNIKHKSSRIQIFEVGKIFYKTSLNHYIEEIQLGGILYNKNYIRKTWLDKPENLNWYYAKGLIECFLEKLNIAITWNQLMTQDITYYRNKNIYKLLHPVKQIAIYHKKTKNCLGFLGQLNKQYTQHLQNHSEPVYLFEVNIEELNKCMEKNQHLTYTVKQYSSYPSVVRDINLKINNNRDINILTKIILKNNKKIIESIEIINEYYNQILHQRYVCLRVTYQAYNRTLNNQDIKHIEKYIRNIYFKNM